MQKTQSYSRPRTQTFDLIVSALLIALVFVATVFLNIKLPIGGNGGLVHLGTGMLFIASILFGPKKGAIAGSLGMALFDLMSGWTIWAPGTFIARGLQGYIVGKIAWSKGKNGNSVGLNILGMVVSIPVMLVVYYLYESIIFGNWIVPLASIPGNLIQIAVGMIVAIPVCIVLKKTPLFK
ncbi:ECF transporter S component [Ureibacillus aquaedulcis]|uniref:ECF transporter S component n=1 Tax=Ureibacillus aquaedulcis TaxID=3058421 RepID=A0ABT8GRQ2_9BACL|nr:ECF transporter S component [Ureibacillus sp. BA0131]MDN4494092.1 ECF transporter S component [Ureibacillus sp. BA0131]